MKWGKAHCWSWCRPDLILVRRKNIEAEDGLAFLGMSALTGGPRRSTSRSPRHGRLSMRSARIPKCGGPPHFGLPLASPHSRVGKVEAPRRPSVRVWFSGMVVGQGRGHDHRCHCSGDVEGHDVFEPLGLVRVAEVAHAILECYEALVDRRGGMPIVPQISRPKCPGLESLVPATRGHLDRAANGLAQRRSRRQELSPRARLSKAPSGPEAAEVEHRRCGGEPFFASLGAGPGSPGPTMIRGTSSNMYGSCRRPAGFASALPRLSLLCRLILFLLSFSACLPACFHGFFRPTWNS